MDWEENSQNESKIMSKKEYINKFLSNLDQYKKNLKKDGYIDYSEEQYAWMYNGFCCDRYNLYLDSITGSDPGTIL